MYNEKLVTNNGINILMTWYAAALAVLIIEKERRNVTTYGGRQFYI